MELKMSVLSEMFSEESENNEFLPQKSVKLLAEGEFTYNHDDVLAGYQLFRKKYTAKKTLFRVILGFFALLSAIFMTVTEEDKKIPIICICICVFAIAWFIRAPIESRRKNRQSAEELKGERYRAEITADSVKIILLNPPEAETEEIEEKTAEETAAETAQTAEDTAEDNLPTTIIHLDQFIVDILDTPTIYIIVVAKKYVFVLPKAAFTEEQNNEIKKTLSDELESRYIVLKM
jgi:uncharacterized membrane protein